YWILLLLAPSGPSETEPLLSFHESRITNHESRLSHQRHPAPLRPPHSPLSLPHLDPQQLRQRRCPPRQFFLIQIRKPQPQRIGQRRLHIKIPPRREQQPAFFRVDQQFARIKSRRQLQPHAHPAFRPRPARLFRHVPPQRFIQRVQSRRIHF